MLMRKRRTTVLTLDFLLRHEDYDAVARVSLLRLYHEDALVFEKDYPIRNFGRKTAWTSSVSHETIAISTQRRRVSVAAYTLMREKPLVIIVTDSDTHLRSGYHCPPTQRGKQASV